MTTSPASPSSEYEGHPDGPERLPDPRLSRAAGLLLVALFLFFVLLVLLGA